MARARAGGGQGQDRIAQDQEGDRLKRAQVLCPPHGPTDLGATVSVFL